MVRLIAFLLLLAASAWSGGPAGVQAAEQEYDLKAWLLYNFARFTEWPGVPREVYHLCILGQDPFGNALRLIETKQVRGKPVEVARLAALNKVTQCEVLFIPEREGREMKRIVQALGDAPTLTVADGPTYPRAMVTLGIEDNRLIFEVDVAQTRQVGLRIAADVLKLSRPVLPAAPN